MFRNICRRFVPKHGQTADSGIVLRLFSSRNDLPFQHAARLTFLKLRGDFQSGGLDRFEVETVVSVLGCGVRRVVVVVGVVGGCVCCVGFCGVCWVGVCLVLVCVCFLLLLLCSCCISCCPAIPAAIPCPDIPHSGRSAVHMPRAKNMPPIVPRINAIKLLFFIFYPHFRFFRPVDYACVTFIPCSKFVFLT